MPVHLLADESGVPPTALVETVSRRDARGRHGTADRKEGLVDKDRVKGKEKELEGKTQQSWGKAKDKARDTWDDAKDKADDMRDDRKRDREAEPASRRT